MKDNSISVTAKAIEQIKIQLKKRGTPSDYLRVGVKGGGCSGYSYVLEFADSISKKDLIFSFDGVNILVDNKSILYLNGCTLEWEQNLLGKGFKFINPNETSKCGCGTSFSV